MNNPTQTNETLMSLAAAIGDAIGTRLTVVSSREWNSVTFSGMTITLLADADLPEIADNMSPDLPGFLLVDLTPAGPCGLEALVVRTDAPNHLETQCD